MSRAALDDWRARLAKQNTTALLVMRHDKIVYEWYAEGNSPEKKQGTASMAKAIVGGSSLMVALQDKRIKVDDLAAKYISAWRTDPQKKLIYIPNGGEGNVTVVHQDSPDAYTVVATVATFAGAKTITVDPNTHNVYLFQPERGPAPPPPPDAPPCPGARRTRGSGDAGSPDSCADTRWCAPCR